MLDLELGSRTNSLNTLSCMIAALTASRAALDAAQSVVTTSVLLNTTDSFGLTWFRFGPGLPAAFQRVVAVKLANATASSVTSPPASGLISEMPPNRPPLPTTRSVGGVAPTGRLAHPGGTPGGDGWAWVIAVSVAPVTLPISIIST